MGVALELLRVVHTNPTRVSYRCIKRSFTIIVVKSSCTRVTRRSASVIRVGVAYVNVWVSRRLKEELSLAIDKRLRLIITIMLFKTVIPLRI